MQKIALSVLLFALLISCLVWQGRPVPETHNLSIAVASNFLSTLERLAEQFEIETGIKVKISSGSSGKLTTQILQGAPFDLFFSADLKYPKILEERRLTIKGSRLTYATGKLVVWAPNNTTVTKVQHLLTNESFHYLAIANPDLAPYGKASQEFLTHLNLWGHLSNKIIKGQNINQTFQFVQSGNAQIGIIALSQALQIKNNLKNDPQFFLVDKNHHAPIEQQVVQLSHSKKQTLAKLFLDFIQEDKQQKFIETAGYLAPTIKESIT